jgi:hypothetical protein
MLVLPALLFECYVGCYVQGTVCVYRGTIEVTSIITRHVCGGSDRVVTAVWELVFETIKHIIETTQTLNHANLPTPRGRGRRVT